MMETTPKQEYQKDMKHLCSDLEEQYKEFDDLVSRGDEKLWQLKTPFYRWTIFDQVAHIVFFDHEALMAIDEPERFKDRARDVMGIIASDKSMKNHTNSLLGIKKPSKLLTHWRHLRMHLIARLNKMSPKNRISWYGPDMSARSFATARLMETWSHAQDIFDALCIRRKNHARLKHVAHMGVTTFNWSFIIRKHKVPSITLRVELEGPSGELWEWGRPDAAEKVWGSAEEFCLVVTQRRNLKDTQLKYQGENVTKWLAMAQAFAGGLQPPPLPGVRVVDYKSNKVQDRV